MKSMSNVKLFSKCYKTGYMESSPANQLDNFSVGAVAIIKHLD